MRLSVLLSALAFSLSAMAQTDQACKSSYDKIYNDHEATISLFLGYSDVDDYVDDQVSKARWVEKATAHCDETTVLQLCDFKRDPDDADIFTKTISRADGTTDKIRLRIRSSSVSTSDKENKGPKKAQQDKNSAQTEGQFLKALQTDDVVIYNGHARRGTGPGFKPMTTTDWMKAAATKQSLNNMVTALKTAKKTPAIIGMVSCEGEEHYGKPLQDAAPNSGLLLTRQTTSFSDSDMIVESSIEGILQKRCAKDFREILQLSVHDIFKSPLTQTASYKDKLPEIYNFFEVNKKKFPPGRGALLTLIDSQWEEVSSRDKEEARERQRKQTPPQQVEQPR